MLMVIEAQQQQNKQWSCSNSGDVDRILLLFYTQKLLKSFQMTTAPEVLDLVFFKQFYFAGHLSSSPGGGRG